MSSCKTPYLFAILMGSSDPFPCLSEDQPLEFDLRLEFCPEEDRLFSFFMVSTENQTENLTKDETENLTENKIEN